MPTRSRRRSAAPSRTARSGSPTSPSAGRRRPTCSTIYAALADEPRATVEQRFAATQFSDFKGELAALAVDKLAPITAEMRRLMAAPDHIDGVLREGAERAEAIAEDNLARVYDLVGFLPR